MSFESHQFKPGEGGRKLGSRNKLSEKFIRDVCAEWEEHGREVLKILRIENPEAFAKLALAIVPKEYEGAPPALMIVTGVPRPNDEPLPRSSPLALPNPFAVVVSPPSPPPSPQDDGDDW